ncbi:MAG: hypothetical protein ACXW11_00065 [Methylotenera sp.]
MTNIIKVEANNLVENFLIDTPNPSSDDWKSLISAHPEYAKEIADAAIFQGSFGETNESVDIAFDQGAYDATISRVLNLVYQTPSAVILKANQKLESIKGPQIKNISVEIGIGSNPSLLNGILGGRIIAPNNLLASISDYLKLPIAILMQVIQAKFEQSAVPSFKSVERKPELRTKPKDWEEAVRDLKLSAAETARLLKFADEDYSGPQFSDSELRW